MTVTQIDADALDAILARADELAHDDEAGENVIADELEPLIGERYYAAHPNETPGHAAAADLIYFARDIAAGLA